MSIVPLNSLDNVFPDVPYANDLVNYFNTLCSSSSDLTAPMKNRSDSQTAEQLWLNPYL